MPYVLSFGVGELRATSAIADSGRTLKKEIKVSSISPINQSRPFGLGGCGEWVCNGLLTAGDPISGEANTGNALMQVLSPSVF